jgi:hypothetical protein
MEENNIKEDEKRPSTLYTAKIYADQLKWLKDNDMGNTSYFLRVILDLGIEEYKKQKNIRI